MSAVWVVATNTVRQAVRQRLFLNVFIFGLGLVLLALIVSQITYSHPGRVVRSIGLSSVAIATNLMILLLSVGTVHQEIESKTLFVVLVRPLRRWQYLLGRYLGILLAVGLVLVGFSLVFCGALASAGATPSGLDLLALLMILPEAAILGAFGLILSSISTPTLSAGLGLGFWAAGATADDLVGLTAIEGGFSHTLAQGVNYVLPAFARFDFRSAAVYESAPASFEVLTAAGYGVLYATALLLLGMVVLERREMT